MELDQLKLYKLATRMVLLGIDREPRVYVISHTRVILNRINLIQSESGTIEKQLIPGPRSSF